MTTAADPAAHTGEPPHTFHRAAGAGSIAAAALSMLALMVIIGADPHSAVTTITLTLALAIVVLVIAGVWCVSEHRARQHNHVAAEQRHLILLELAAIREDVHVTKEETAAGLASLRTEMTAGFDALRADMKELGRVMLRAGGQRGIDDLMTMVNQLSDRVTAALMKRAEAEAVERKILERLDHIEASVAAAASPNVYDIGAARDLRTIQQRFDDESDRG